MGAIKIKHMFNVMNVAFISMLSLFCAEHKSQTMDISDEKVTVSGQANDTATFATGCFWCTEAIFQRLKGVKSYQRL